MGRFIVVGAGAIGGVVGARLRMEGAEVVLVARGAHGDAIARRGLVLQDPKGENTLNIPVVGRVHDADLRHGDIVLCAVKSQHTASVVDAVVTSGGVQLPLVHLQNGVCNERLSLRRVRNVYGCAVMCPAVFLEPGVVRAHGGQVAGLLDVGRFPSGVDRIAENVAEAFRSAGFLSNPRPDIAALKYGKLLSNLGNAIEVVCGPVHRPGPLGTLIFEEGKGILDSCGIRYLIEDDPRRALIAPVKVAGVAREGGSTFQSVHRSAGSIETPFLNGEIALEARLHHLSAPANETITELADEVASGRRPLSGTTVDEVTRLIEARVGPDA